MTYLIWSQGFKSGGVELGNATLTPRIHLSYTSEQFFDAANSREVGQLEDVTLLNASLPLELGAWRLRGGGLARPCHESVTGTTRA